MAASDSWRGAVRAAVDSQRALDGVNPKPFPLACNPFGEDEIIAMTEGARCSYLYPCPCALGIHTYGRVYLVLEYAFRPLTRTHVNTCSLDKRAHDHG